MKTEAKSIDRSEWGSGPWDGEPDRVEFETECFPCLIVRVPNLGHLCGYVAVPPGHPWHGKHYDDIGADVHGGLTYAEACHGRVCHVPKPGEPDNVWWLGFDCAHCGDLSPYMRRRFGGIAPTDEYRGIVFVQSNCVALALQAKAAT